MKKRCSLFLLILMARALALSQTFPAPPDTTSGSSWDTLAAIGLIKGSLSISGMGTRNPGWTSFTLSGESLLRLPERRISSYLPFLPGIIDYNGGLHVRGSRAYANQYLLEGTRVLNPLYGTPAVILIPQAVGSVDVHTGPFGSHLPSATGGMIETKMRTGGDRFEVSAEYRTDDFVAPGNTFLGTTPQGLKDIVLTMGGPITESLHYFLAGEYTYIRNDQSLFLEPFRFEGLTDDGFRGGSTTRGRLLLAADPADNGTIEFKRNFVSKNWTRSSALNANIRADLNTLAGIPVTLTVSTVFGKSRFPGGGPYPGSGGDWNAALNGYLRSEDREMMNETKTAWTSAMASLRLGPQSVFDLTVSYQHHSKESYDPDFGRSGFDDFLQYPDSVAHASHGFNTDEWRSRYMGPYVQSTIYGFNVLHPSAPNNSYSKNDQRGLSFQGRLSTVVSSAWELEVGGGFESWTMRKYEFGNIQSLLMTLDPNQDGDFSDHPVFANEYEQRVRYLQRGQITSYGYDYLGNRSNGYTVSGSPAVLDPPYTPMFASAYAQIAYDKDEIEASIGLRYEFFSPAFKDLPKNANANDPGTWYDMIERDWQLGIIDESKIEESANFSFILPSARLSVPIPTGGKIYFAFGSYASLPSLDGLYLSSEDFSASILDGPYTLTGRGVAFEVKPERSTHYELGTRLALSRRVVVSGSFYYKNLWNQLQIGQYLGVQGEPVFASYQSTGYGSAKGIELALDLLRGNGLAISVAYAYVSAGGLSSDPLTTLPLVTDDPPSAMLYAYPRPYDYEKRHTAAGIVDYRSGKEALPVFQDVNLTGIFTFQSGHPYTQEYPYVPGWGLATPWTIGVWSSVDPRMYDPLEPRNSSQTPKILNLDVRIAKGFQLGEVLGEVSFAVLNVFNTRHIQNVYPTTGSASADGWLGSGRVPPYLNVPLYDEFYRAINLNNRWAYVGATGNDLYGSPRQFRIGLTVTFGSEPPMRSPE